MPVPDIEGSTKIGSLKRRRRVRWIVLASLLGVPVVVVGVGLLKQGGYVEVTPPPVDAEPGRWVWIEGAENTRDIGGYKTKDGRSVRRGCVYRSANLSHVTEAGCKAFRELKVATVIDFRNRVTALPLYGGDVFGIHRVAKVVGIPISFNKEGHWREYYVRGLRDNADAFRKTFDLIAEPERLPLMYHCNAGTDRAGVMTALLLTLLGVDRDTVIADFRLSEKVGHSGNLGAMERLLDEIDAAGGIEGFLVDLGVSKTIQTRIRELLLTQ